MNSPFLEAFAGTNETIPVWFMRQAGRYLPEYQAIKAAHSLETMFKTPDLAAEITCQPIDILGVDAAILFADILTLPGAMGFKIGFDDRKGPVIDTHFKMKDVHDHEEIGHITETIKQVKNKLTRNIPLIGFAGSPFTVLSFLIEGGSSVGYKKLFKYMKAETDAFHQLMEILTINTIRYLQQQIKAGADVVQLFDTCAGILSQEDFKDLVLPYVQRIFAALKVPSIYFVRNTAHLLSLLDLVNSDFLSVDHTVNLGTPATLNQIQKGVQGNLFNGNLYLDYPQLEKEVEKILLGGSQHQRYIFNLSHGVFPDVEVDKLKFVVDKVHEFKKIKV
ncbi:MAG: uroporphyrinogen decarboxylase [Candidatus Omnitrophica bacterium]|nr:uroporphyrinogen decarboxylase [Candidatus Omnitrophota bacterium]